VKKELDKRFSLSWHVVVGSNFGSFVSHEEKTFCHYYLGDMGFLVFKTRPEH
jgi:dynein light chain LC8-type